MSMAARRVRSLAIISGLVASCGSAASPWASVDDARAGRAVITRMACGSCHTIPGIEEANGRVGPPLAHFATRRTVAGVLPNAPANLVRFLSAPQSVAPGIVMPDEHLTPAQARANRSVV